jgi:phosphomannomutase
MRRLREILSYTPVELDFGTSGLRGMVSDMTDLECYINTLGFIQFLVGHDGLKLGSTIHIAGDLRDSTPRITAAVVQAVVDSGFKAEYLGKIPTPAAAYHGLLKKQPVVVVTGSHIPAERNGIKFYKRAGEVLKADEQPIKQAVALKREAVYTQSSNDSPFDRAGSLKTPPKLPAETSEATKQYMQRYQSVFSPHALADKTIVLYQHSAVGRDLLVALLESHCAQFIPVGRSDIFIPIDSENVTPANRTYFRSLARQYPQAFAIVSTDGDSDRPFVIDETGTFHRGDILGAIVAEFLGAKCAAYPITSNDAVDTYLQTLGISFSHTKIGSPYVVVAMQEAFQNKPHPVVGWEVNGGFMLGSEVALDNATLSALPTRDAALPIICALLAANQHGLTLSELFRRLPQRFTQAGLLDNVPPTASKQLLARYNEDTPTNRQKLSLFFTKQDGFDSIAGIDSLDGIRTRFKNGDVVHIRPSGNAPQLRIYSVANSQQRADGIIAKALGEPDGILHRLLQSHSV